MLLKDNPFYILDVGLSSDRRKIAEAADEISFLMGSEKSSEAQSILTSPVKRLEAELTWFPEASNNDIVSIRNSISGNQPIITSALSGYSKFNALVYNMSIAEYSGIYELGFHIVAIDEQYSSINIAQVTKTINQAREKAGIAAASESEVQDCHRAMIEEIRKLINEKFKSYDDDSYVHFVTVVAEQYIVDKRYNAGPILYDIIDQYEIRMQSEIESRSDQIIKYVELIKSEQSEDVIKKSIPKVIERVEAWDTYAQPLQLRSQASGLPHESSRKLAYEMRGLILYLNNEKHMASEAKELAVAMKAVFLELGELKEVFSNDTVKLDEIEKDKKNNEAFNEIKSDFDKLEQFDKKPISSFLEPPQLKEYIALVSSLNDKILRGSFDAETKQKLRTTVFYHARKISVDIYNNARKPLVAKYILCELTDMFGDIKEVREKIHIDLLTMDANSDTNYVTMSNYKQFMDKYIGPTAMKAKLEKKARIKKLIIGIIALVFAFFIIKNIVPNNQSKSRSGSNSYSGSSSVNYTAKPTSKPTKIPETAYSSSSKTGDYVYVDVASIDPVRAIYTTETKNGVPTGLSYYSQFICKCETSTGKTVWVFFDASDFKNDIDPSLSTLVSTITKTFDSPTQYYSPAARVHGKVISPESALSYKLSSRSSILSEINSDTVIEYNSIDVPEQVTPITPLNVNDYFAIDVEGKEYDGSKGLTVTYSIKPRSQQFAKKKKISPDIIIKLQISVSKTKNGASFKTKDYTVILNKSNQYSATGEILIPFVSSVDNIYWGYEIISCDGYVDY